MILRCELGTILFTGDYKFDQTPVGGAPADVVAARRARARRACCCCAATPPTPTARASSPSRVASSGRTSSACSPAARAGSSSRASRRTSTACSRSSTPPPRSTARSAWSGARCARTSTSGARSATSTCRRGSLVPPRELDQLPDDRVVIISTGSQGEPLSALRRMAYRDHHADRAARGRHRRLLRHADPGQRARGQRDDRPPLPDRLRGHHAARGRAIHASGHGYQEEIKLMLNLTQPRYVMPVHGDYKRIRLHSAARRRPSASRRRTSSRARTACRSRSPRRARAGASARRPA